MNQDEIIKMLESIKKDAERLHSGNVAHQRAHIVANTQFIIETIREEGIKQD